VVVGYKTLPIPDEDAPEVIPDDPDRPEEIITVSF
jgi:hypothetical protein